MNKSETTKELALALSKAQAEMPPAELNATNPFLKNKYADLGSIIKASKPVLAKYGLSVAQLPTSNGDKIGITTILMHSSGEWLESTMMLPIGEAKGVSTAQAAGAIISYLRRYSLASALGMYAEEDIDGNGDGTERKTTRKKTEQTQSESGNDGNEDIYQALADEKLFDNKHAAYNTLSNYCSSGFDTLEKATAWSRLYRGWRDMDKTPQEAGKLANEGKEPK